MAGKRRYSKKKMFGNKAQDKVITATPRKAIQMLETQVVALKKGADSLKKVVKPETKYFDSLYTAQYLGIEAPHQNYINYPANGAAENQRVGSRIKQIYMDLKGQVLGNAGNSNGGYVTFYVLHYVRQRSIAAATYYNAINNLAGIGPFIITDPSGNWTQQSFRDFNHTSDWKIMKKINIAIKPDNLASQSEATNFSFRCKLKDIWFDYPGTSNITKGMCQIFAVCNRGVLGASPGAGDGFSLNYNYRMTYIDS